MYINTLHITGNLTHDTVIKYMPNGTPVLQFSIANNRSYKKDDEWQQDTSFFNVVAYGQTAERWSEELGKGMEVLIEGRLSQRSYKNKDGVKVNVVEIIALKIHNVFRSNGTTADKPPQETPLEAEETTADKPPCVIYPQRYG